METRRPDMKRLLGIFLVAAFLAAGSVAGQSLFDLLNTASAWNPMDDCTDNDGDGYGDPASVTCTYPDLDCDDVNPDVNPGMTEIPENGLDDDCDPETHDIELFSFRFDVDLGGYSIGAASAGDLNEDGSVDLAVGTDGLYEAGVLLMFGQGNGAFQAPATVWSQGPEYSVLFDFGGISVGDVNDDQISDLVLAHSVVSVAGPPFFGGIVSVLIGQGDGAFEEAVVVEELFMATVSSVALEDLNHDNHPDIVVAISEEAGSSDVMVLVNQGDGTFSTPSFYGTGSGGSSAVVADVDNDTHPDLAVTLPNADQVSVFLGSGDGTFLSGGTFDVGDVPIAMAADDLNQDSASDLVVVNRDGDDLSVLLGHGDGTFDAAVSYPMGDAPAGVVVEDFDGDGLPDLAVACQGDDALHVLMGNGDGTFGNEGQYGGPNMTALPVTEDYNEDGSPDLAVAGVDRVWVFTNEQGANPAWGAAATVLAGAGSVSKAISVLGFLAAVPLGFLLLLRGRGSWRKG